jgi:hypothetical protein
MGSYRTRYCSTAPSLFCAELPREAEPGPRVCAFPVKGRADVGVRVGVDVLPEWDGTQHVKATLRGKRWDHGPRYGAARVGRVRSVMDRKRGWCVCRCLRSAAQFITADPGLALHLALYAE